MLRANSPAYLVLVQEKAIMEKKTEILDNYVKSILKGEQDDIEAGDLEILQEQLHYMKGYLKCLTYRISRVQS